MVWGFEREFQWDMIKNQDVGGELLWAVIQKEGSPSPVIYLLMSASRPCLAFCRIVAVKRRLDTC
jgi:hypothetical protein